jgi:hypothetical protein
MSVSVYRDISCLTDAETAFELWTRLTSNGYVASSWSNGTTRVAGAGPASASDLSATNSYWVVRFSTNGRWVTVKRSAANNWLVEYTSADGTMAGGNGTTPDRDATLTKIWLNSTQIYPSSGVTATKLHTVVNNANGSFACIGRRTPNVGGSTDACFIVFLDIYTPGPWSSNPDPAMGGAIFNNNNTAASTLMGNVSGWYAKGLGGASYKTNNLVDNPGNTLGSATADPAGQDIDYEIRWTNATTPVIYGISSIFRGLQPYRNPIVGIDSGGTLTRAAFGGLTVLNDGVALTS